MGGSDSNRRAVGEPRRLESTVRRAVTRREHVAAIRQAVLAQAAGDMMELRLEAGRLVATVPRAPFMHWALGRTSLRHLAPPWLCISPSGMKFVNDDRHHSDWFYGATIVDAPDGFDAGEYAYGGDVDKAAQREMFALQWRLGNFACEVLVDAGEVAGVVGQQIAVLRDLRPEQMTAILGATGIVTQAGGQLAHLAQIAMARRITILRVPDACSRFRAGMRLTLQPAIGMVRVAVERR